MSKLLVVVGVGFLGLIALLSVLTALASAGASLANGVANAAASTALMTSQCTAALMILIALVAGAVFGIGIKTMKKPSPPQDWPPRPPAQPGFPYPALPGDDWQILYPQDSQPPEDAEFEQALTDVLKRW